MFMECLSQNEHLQTSSLNCDRTICSLVFLVLPPGGVFDLLSSLHNVIVTVIVVVIVVELAVEVCWRLRSRVAQADRARCCDRDAHRISACLESFLSHSFTSWPMTGSCRIAASERVCTNSADVAVD